MLKELKNSILRKSKIGETIPVLLEKIEDKNGDLVSASKAQKLKGGISWLKLMRKMNQ